MVRLWKIGPGPPPSPAQSGASPGPKFSVENWSGWTDFFGKNGPPLENASAISGAVRGLSRTKIFSGKLVRPERFFSGKMVRLWKMPPPSPAQSGASPGPKFSVENWSGRTDFFGKNGPPLENASAIAGAVRGLSRTKIFSGKLVRPDRFFREKWSASGKCLRHRRRSPGPLPDQNFQWKIGPAGPIFSGKMVRLWKIVPGPPPSPAQSGASAIAGAPGLSLAPFRMTRFGPLAWV